MIATFFFATIAGFLVTRAEPWLDVIVERVAGEEAHIDALDFRALAVFVMLALAAIAVQAVGADSSLYLGALGGALGYFGPRLVAFALDPDGTARDPDDKWREPETPAKPDAAPVTGNREGPGDDRA